MNNHNSECASKVVLEGLEFAVGNRLLSFMFGSSCVSAALYDPLSFSAHIVSLLSGIHRNIDIAPLVWSIVEGVVGLAVAVSSVSMIWRSRGAIHLVHLVRVDSKMHAAK